MNKLHSSFDQLAKYVSIRFAFQSLGRVRSSYITIDECYITMDELVCNLLKLSPSTRNCPIPKIQPLMFWYFTSSSISLPYRKLQHWSYPLDVPRILCKMNDPAAR